MNTALADRALGRNTVAYPKTSALSLTKQRRLLKLWLACTDAVVLVLAFQIALWLRFDVKLTVAPEFTPSPGFYFGLISLMIPCWILIFLVFDLYSLQTKLGGIAEYARIFNASTMGAMILIIISFLSHQSIVSRSWLMVSWLLTFILVSLSRFVNRRMVYALRVRGFLLTPAAIIGLNEEAATLATDLADWRVSGLRILGFVSCRDESPGNGNLSLPVLGSVEDIGRLIATHGIEDLVVATTAVSHDELLKLGREVNEIPHVNLRLSSGLYELFTTGVTVRTLGTVPLISINKMRLEPEEVFVKRILDYSLTLAFLLLAWPLFLVIALLVKLDSPGPAFHRHRVLGLSGRPFDALKFRTMVLDGDALLRDKPELLEKLQTDFKLKDDPRVTRVGHWLRKASLDELPQLFNILLGDMSLVGPRFITAVEAESKYGLRRISLLTVKPGLTGLWQVSGRSDISYEDRIRLDMYYIRNYSIWLDLQILFVQTLPAVLRSRGAY